MRANPLQKIVPGKIPASLGRCEVLYVVALSLFTAVTFTISPKTK